MPMIQARLLELARLRVLRRLERQRGSRVVTLIHRQESRSALRHHPAKVTVIVPPAHRTRSMP